MLLLLFGICSLSSCFLAPLSVSESSDLSSVPAEYHDLEEVFSKEHVLFLSASAL